MIKILAPKQRREAVKRITELSGQPISLCLQCGKCTSGCPMSEDMDLTPHQIVHYAQLGLIEEIASAEGIWYCASCFTCYSRCPVGIDIAALTEAIRLLAKSDDSKAIEPENVPRDLREDAPQQALVSLYRKFSRQ